MGTIDRRTLLARSVSGAASFFALSVAPGLGAAPHTAEADGAYDFTAGMAGCGQVALMFNIGAGYDPATGILQTLGDYGVPATMFIMGWLAAQNPGLVQQIAAWGHPIGSHGNLPPELTTRSDDDITADLLAASDNLTWALGYNPGPWFSPYASASDDRVRAIANSLGLIEVGWSLTSGDWTPEATADGIYSTVVGGIFDGAIVELHMDAQRSVDGTAVALPWILDDLIGQGYQLVTVPQIAGGC
jgi:peptidoglycan/xylan/chitin deacetylase (PgdA/CDA1 family)